MNPNYQNENPQQQPEPPVPSQPYQPPKFPEQANPVQPTTPEAPAPYSAPIEPPTAVPSYQAAQSETRGFFSGRLNRRGYVVAWAWLLVASIIVSILIGVISKATDGNFIVATLLTLLVVAVNVLVDIALVALIIRRLHDFNKTGFWAFLLLAPIANIVFLIAIFFIPGTKGPNAYGDAAQDGLGIKPVFGIN